MEARTYIAIDLKSFYASVECVERGLDPMDTHLVVADQSRTEKTIGLSVSPALKAHGVPGRPRLFEVIQKALRDQRRTAHRSRLGLGPCTIADIKAYKPESSSMGSGQVLTCPYTFEQARLVVREMADALALDLVDKRLVTDLVVLDVGYDTSNVISGELENTYHGETKPDRYGRKAPKPVHGSSRFARPTSSSKQISNAVMSLYERITDPTLTIRRLNLTAGNVVNEEENATREVPEQLDMFTDYESVERQRKAEAERLAREKQEQLAILEIKKTTKSNKLFC